MALLSIAEYRITQADEKPKIHNNSVSVNDGYNVNINTRQYDTIAEFNVDSKAEYYGARKRYEKEEMSTLAEFMS